MAFDLPLSAEYTNGNALFQLHDHLDAKKVTLTGSFNNWNKVTSPLTRRHEGWACRISLPPGKYEYKFLVDDVWTTDPANSATTTDSDGNKNSVYIVPP